MCERRFVCGLTSCGYGDIKIKAVDQERVYSISAINSSIFSCFLSNTMTCYVFLTGFMLGIKLLNEFIAWKLDKEQNITTSEPQ